MKKYLILMLWVFAGLAHAQDLEHDHAKAPHCHAIVEACKKAGFVANDWKNGDGLYVHCVDPILGRPASPKAPAVKSGLVRPVIASSDVQACLTEKPTIGTHSKKK